MQSVLERSYAQPKIFDGRAVKKNGTPKPIRWTVDEYYQMYDLDFVYSDRCCRRNGFRLAADKAQIKD